MPRWVCGWMALAGWAVLGVCSVEAEEKLTTEQAVVADMKPELIQYVKIMEEFGNGKIDAALDLLEPELPGPFTKPKGPFEIGTREKWREQFEILSKVNPQFESVDLIGYQPLSSAARKLIFIGNGKHGPILFRYRVFRYGDQWKISGISFQASYEAIEQEPNFTRFNKPLNYPTTNQPIATKPKSQSPKSQSPKS